MPLSPGTKLGSYEVLSSLGVGGMGEVYRAHDARLDREVAIKVLPAGGHGSVQRERFVREARAASALVHPNIITIHEIDAADGVDFIVMEYVRGESLATVLARGPLPLARALEYSVQIADALKAAHQAGVIHRDLKPGNIMISSSGLVKVLDFGIAKRMGGGAGDGERTTAAALTVAGSSIGTPAYMSPEQTLGDEVDARSDLFSFGVVFYEMLAGQLPFQSTTNLSLVRQIVHEPAKPLRSAAPDVPDEIVAIVERCLAKEPAGRYASAEILHDELRSVATRIGSLTVSRVEHVTREAPAPAAAVEAQRRPRASRGRIIAASILLIGLVAWAGGPAFVRWIRIQVTPSAELADEHASAQELYARGSERLRLYYREGNLDRAIAQLERALTLKSPNPSVEARLGLAYLRRNNISPDPEWKKRAIAHAERAVAGSEQLAIAHIALGAAEVIAGHPDKAVAAYQKAETLDPANWELLFRLGELAVTQKDPDAAEKYFRRATEAGPQEWESHSKLGVFLYGKSRYTEAIASFEKMRDAAPDHPRAYSNLAAAYHQLGRSDEAAAILQKALQIAPDAQTYSNLGTYLYFQGKYPEAERAFDEAVKLNANSYQRWGNLGDAARMTSPGTEKMHDSYRRAIQLGQDELTRRPTDANVRSSVALYLVRDGQTPDALAELDRVLSQKELASAVLFKAALIAELANQRPKALGLLRQALAAGYQLREITAEPDLVKLRADPEYHKLASQYEK